MDRASRIELLHIHCFGPLWASRQLRRPPEASGDLGKHLPRLIGFGQPLKYLKTESELSWRRAQPYATAWDVEQDL